jgi:hypothetical protein
LTAEFYGEHEKFGDELAAIEDDNAAGAEVRRRIGVKLVRGIGRMFHTTGQTMPAIDEFSLTTVPIDLYFNEQPLSKGTAFTWERDNNCRAADGRDAQADPEKRWMVSMNCATWMGFDR